MYPQAEGIKHNVTGKGRGWGGVEKINAKSSLTFSRSVLESSCMFVTVCVYVCACYRWQTLRDSVLQ